MFLVLVIFFFKTDVFVANLWGGTGAEQEYLHAHGDLIAAGAAAKRDYGSLFQQVMSTMLVTVFVFLGIEGASNYSRFAKKRSDVGKATVVGFLGVLALFASVSILSFGILPRAELQQLSQPSVGGVLAAAVGPWGATFIGIGVIVSVLGAYLAWTLMSAEVLSIAAKKGDMPDVPGQGERQPGAEQRAADEHAAGAGWCWSRRCSPTMPSPSRCRCAATCRCCRTCCRPPTC